MFYGSYKNTLDTKGRLIVPKAFREQLGEQTAPDPVLPNPVRTVTYRYNDGVTPDQVTKYWPGKEVVIDGSMKRIELWSREKYIEATAADDIDASMEALDGLDIDL